MLGKPKYKVGDKVSFTLKNQYCSGEIYIVDAYGTFDCETEVCYDIFVDGCLYKHVRESMINE